MSIKVFQGKVKSTKNKNTVIAEVERFYVHPLYEKRVKRSKVYAVHVEIDVNIGDTIRFVETRPISKTKRWKVIEVLFSNKSKTPGESVTETPKGTGKEVKKQKTKVKSANKRLKK